MVSKLKDSEILNFLMTSDFDDDYKPDELKYLLTKWRYFYRILNGRLELNKTDSEFLIKKLKEDLKSKEDEINYNRIENSKLKDELNFLKNKKLSLKERILGKIINNNENK